MQGGKEGHIAVSGDCTVAVNGGMDARCGQLTPHPVDALFFFQAEDGIRDIGVTGVQTCLPISLPVASAHSNRPPPAQSPKTSALIWVPGYADSQCPRSLFNDWSRGCQMRRP